MISYEDLAASFQARHIAVPMRLAVSVRPDMTVGEALEMLEGRGYDQAPILDEGQVAGYVLTEELRIADRNALVRDVGADIRVGRIVSADAPIGEALDWVLAPGLLFILEGRRITGFVTVSDFNKQPARTYLYLLVASLEIALADLVRRRYPDSQQTAIDRLTKPDREQVMSRYQADRALDIESDLVAYLDFSQLLTTIAKDKSLRQVLGYASRASWKDETGAIVKLRNDVMHPVRNLVLSRDGLHRVRDLEVRARRVLAAAQSAVLDGDEHEPSDD